MSCSQPRVLWQPSVGRWVLCVSRCARWVKQKTCSKLVSSQINPPQKKFPSRCVCSACTIHSHWMRLFIRHSSVLGASPLAFTGVWYVWRSSFFSFDGAKNPLCASLWLSVAEATAGSTLDGGNIALAVFILVLLLSVLLGGAYVYVTRWAGITSPARVWRAVFY